ncbi:hypothetical protein BDV29DRAFT_163522 [Aspergillus leporis]|jgi:hypothetical protein|uniref:Uncharacterized protein n=1 Tax=Aspergillus leporis TaxID=41062 RepID=A0A5N5WGP1_9EURO|nr:hypothetical protein BDV29DRAFT_163522 [Aspergillus leporis]
MASVTQITPVKPALTTNDSAVLQTLFDAESSTSKGMTINPSLPPFPANLNITSSLYETLKAKEVSLIRTLQSPKTTTAIIQTAITALTAIIKEHRNYPPAYANRAQALRMLIDSSACTNGTETREPNIFTTENNSTITTLLSDLGKAIALATPRSPAGPVSEVQARLLADVHTHRGYLLLKLAKGKKSGGGVVGPEQCGELDADQLEEMASQEFFFGGRYGNRVAQQMAVQTNPYAKMCGAIVKEALRKEVEGEIA